MAPLARYRRNFINATNLLQEYKGITMQTPAPGPDVSEGLAPRAVETGGGVARRYKIVLRRVAIGVALLVGTLAGLLIGLIAFDLESNPIVGRFVRDRLVIALQDRIDPSLRIEIGKVDLKRESSVTLVKISDFALKTTAGRALVVAPEGTVTLSSTSLIGLRLEPRDVRLDGLKVAVEVDAAGGLMVGAPDGRDEPSPAGIVTAGTDAPLDQLRQLIGSGFAGLSALRDAVGGRLPQVGVKDAEVSIHDRRSGKSYALSGINTVMESQPNGAARSRTEVKMRDVSFAVGVEIAPQAEGRQSFAARTENLHLAELFAVLGVSAGGIDPLAPVNMTITAEVDKEGKARAASAGVAIGKTQVTLEKPDESFLLDSIAASVAWTEGDTVIALPRFSFAVGASKLALSGDIRPPETAEQGWTIRLVGKDQVLEGAGKGDVPVEITLAQATFQAFPSQRRLTIENASVSGPKVNATVSGDVHFDAQGRPGLRLEVGAREMDARAALGLWPIQAAHDVRSYVLAHLKSGVLTQFQLALDFSPDVMELAWNEKPIPDASLAIRWTLARGFLATLKGAPPIRDLAGAGVVTGRTARIDVASAAIDAGQGRRVTLSDGQFAVADLSRKPAEARIRTKFSGSIDALAEVLRAPAFQAHAPKGLDPQTVKGQGEGELSIQMRLSAAAQPGDARVGINATLRNVSVDKVIGNDKLENGTFTVTTERDVMTLKGEAKMFGTPVTIEVKGATRGAGQASLTMVLDEAARARKGITLGTMLTGPVQLKLSTPFGDSDSKDVSAELDLARAAVAELVPGWSKKAGVPGRAKARVLGIEGGWQLDRMEVEAGTLSMRGAMTLANDGAFQKAQLSSFKLSAGDNVQLDADRTGGLTRIAIKGNAFDVRPFLRSLQTGAIDKSGARDTEITLKTTVLSGFGGELVSNADLKLMLRGTDLRRFDMTGRFDQGNVTAKLQTRAGQPPLLNVESEDAGAFLRFFDIYSRMRGGDMILSVALGNGSQSGNIFVKDFSLRNEPAMKRLVTDTASAGTADSARIAPEVARRLANSTDVPFTKMTASFSRTPGRFDVKESVMWGPEIGGSLSGSLDYLRDRVDLTGTFVPAYSLNNMFSQVPVLGPLLGGGRNEGLFAVRYSITGRVSAPTLSINPLTAIAPGFLRKLIDFRGAGGSGPSATPRHEQ